jgi:hypothetical protein
MVENELNTSRAETAASVVQQNRLAHIAPNPRAMSTAAITIAITSAASM